MIIILLVGGPGRQLWPLSNANRTKPFLPVLESPTGIRESMLQRIWRQLDIASLQQNTFLSGTQSQMELASNQLGAAIPFIREPSARDTFPAVALAAAYLHSISCFPSHETIVVLPVDLYLQAEAFECIKRLPQKLQESGAEIISAGVKSDIFAFQLETMLAKLILEELPVQYEKLYKQYECLKQETFELAFANQICYLTETENSGVQWRRIGAWTEIAAASGDYEAGQENLATGTEQAYIINELNIPIAVAGLSHLIIAAGPSGIMITDKSASITADEMNALNERQLPMYEEQSWGHAKIIDYSEYGEGRQSLTRKLTMRTGRHMSYGLHLNKKVMWSILSGEGEFIHNEQSRVIGAGDLIEILPRTRHSIRALTSFEFLELQIGTMLLQDDRIVLDTEWDNIRRQ